jgi:predicted murein hydrolase (TIGR00659 family)
MKELLCNSTYFGVLISLIGYGLGMIIKSKVKMLIRNPLLISIMMAILNPLLISIIFVIIVLLALNVDYESYNNGAKYLSYFLTPATVCLAIPLYQQLELLKGNFRAILGGIIAGVITSMGSILLLSTLFHLTREQYITLLPKSVTTAIGMGISKELGGIVTITVAVIIITGILGNMLAEFVCRVFRIKEPIAKGIALGTSAHAIGTVKAMEMGEVEGAMSSLAIAVAGLVTVLGASFFANIM